ncbi:MAG: hypothetical protein CMH53_03840 [Myxococcales bacterium]|nr:hypothetical protein [Myxococcales bacterium]
MTDQQAAALSAPCDERVRFARSLFKEFSMTRSTRALKYAALVALLASAAILSPQPANAAVPATVGLEGRLATPAGGPVADGDYTLTFSLYASASAPQATWSETAKVKLSAGRFAHALGSVKALNPSTLDSAKGGWVGVKVGQDPELTRTPFLAVPFAARAALAESAAVAAVAKGLNCTGCVSVGTMKFDGDVDLAGNSIKVKNLTASGDVVAASVTASSFSGDGSKLTGLQIAGGSCKVGWVVTGIKADGSVTCSAAPPAKISEDALGQLSNGLLKNVFDEKFEGVAKAIPDNNPGGVISEVKVPDVGIVKSISVTVDLTNADISGLVVTLFDPLNKQYVLHNKSGKGAYLKTSFPAPTKAVSGDITSWEGQNAKGTWRLIVADWKDNGGGNDGKINSWTMNIKYLSSKKIVLKGDLVADGAILTDGGKSNCFVKDTGKGYSALYCGDKMITGWATPTTPLMKRIFAGGHQSCGILLDDTMLCWGKYDSGNGWKEPPKLTDKLQKLSLSYYEGCALRLDGSLKCWGRYASSAPSGTFTDIACNHTSCCAVTNTEAMKCWGKSDHSQTNSPVGKYAEVDAGYHHYCALTTAGDVKCWGYNNKSQTDVPKTNDVYSQVSLGNYHSCALRKKDGYARCWGKWDNNENVSSYTGPFSTLVQGRNYYHCGLRPGGEFFCWGNSSFWDNVWHRNNYAEARANIGPFIDAQVSRHDHTCFLRRDLTAACVGSNSQGKLQIPEVK